MMELKEARRNGRTRCARRSGARGTRKRSSGRPSGPPDRFVRTSRITYVVPKSDCCCVTRPDSVTHKKKYFDFVFGFRTLEIHVANWMPIQISKFRICEIQNGPNFRPFKSSVRCSTRHISRTNRRFGPMIADGLFRGNQSFETKSNLRAKSRWSYIRIGTHLRGLSTNYFSCT